jgi:hypothetical protein
MPDKPVSPVSTEALAESAYDQHAGRFRQSPNGQTRPEQPAVPAPEPDGADPAAQQAGQPQS